MSTIRSSHRVGLELLEQLALAGRLDLEAAERVRGADQLERRAVVERRSGRDRPSRRWCARSRRARGASTRASARRGCRASGSRAARRRPCRPGPCGGRSRSARAAPARPGRGSTRTMPHGCSAMWRGNPSEPLGHPEQQLELRHGQVDARGAPGRRSSPSRRWRAEMCGNAFATTPTSTSGRPSALPTSRTAARARYVSIMATQAARSSPWRDEDHVVDVLAPRRLDVDVDVGQLVAHRVEEPLERQVVAQRVDVGDAGQVADERAGGRAPARREDAHRLDVGDDVGHGQEVAPRTPSRRIIESSRWSRSRSLPRGLTHPRSSDAAPAPLGEQRRRRCGPAGVGKSGKWIRFSPRSNVHVSASASVASQRSGRSGEQRAHRGRRLQPPLRVRPRDVVRGDRHDLPHALQRVGEERVLGHEVAHRVRGDGGDLEPLGEPEHRADLGVGAGLHAMLDSHDTAVAPERLAERGGEHSGRRRSGRRRPAARRASAARAARPSPRRARRSASE